MQHVEPADPVKRSEQQEWQRVRTRVSNPASRALRLPRPAPRRRRVGEAVVRLQGMCGVDRGANRARLGHRLRAARSYRRPPQLAAEHVRRNARSPRRSTSSTSRERRTASRSLRGGHSIAGRGNGSAGDSNKTRCHAERHRLGQIRNTRFERARGAPRLQSFSSTAARSCGSRRLGDVGSAGEAAGLGAPSRCAIRWRRARGARPRRSRAVPPGFAGRGCVRRVRLTRFRRADRAQLARSSRKLVLTSTRSGALISPSASSGRCRCSSAASSAGMRARRRSRAGAAPPPAPAAMTHDPDGAAAERDVGHRCPQLEGTRTEHRHVTVDRDARCRAARWHCRVTGTVTVVEHGLGRELERSRGRARVDR